VTGKLIHAPWLMDGAAQQRAGVIIGRDYPAPMVDHGEARRVALELFAAAKAAHEGSDRQG
jgi:deoxyribodipyrimidine photo-lyase